MYLIETNLLTVFLNPRPFYQCLLLNLCANRVEWCFCLRRKHLPVQFSVSHKFPYLASNCALICYIVGQLLAHSLRILDQHFSSFSDVQTVLHLPLRHWGVWAGHNLHSKKIARGWLPIFFAFFHKMYFFMRFKIQRDKFFWISKFPNFSGFWKVKFTDIFSCLLNVVLVKNLGNYKVAPKRFSSPLPIHS